MHSFAYERATSVATARDAVSAEQAESESKAFLAGGTTLIDLMRLDVMRPDLVVDINPLASTALGRIEANAAGLRLGALVRMADAADHAAVMRDYPAIAQSLNLAASPQLRNMASLGGNVLQRTRCPYFRDTSYHECNKRNPGSGCAAIEGYNRQHAVLGASSDCIATYPGDFAQALIALDAQIEMIGDRGRRVIPMMQLHRLPGERPDLETTLDRNEVITAFIIPAAAWTRRSLYLKVRDRQSYEFALASAAVALDLADDRTVRTARIALGGVATVPWRAREAEAALIGVRLDARSARAAAEAAFQNARPQTDNAFKIALGKETLVRALVQVATMEI